MNQLVLDFAHEELRRLQNKAHDKTKIKLHALNAINKEGFEIQHENSEVTIAASTSSGLLYGVYSYASQYLGYDFSKLGQEHIVEKELLSTSQSFNFERRGNIFEVINDIDYLKKQIDSNTKHYHNEIFFTFPLFDEVIEALEADIDNRGIKVTLGGHSLQWLLEPILTLEKNEDENLSFYSNEPLMNYVVDRIVAVCKQYSCVSRISLWPQDIGIPQSKGLEFMQAYIDFTHRIKKALVKEKLEVAVEYIVYNAGLNWEMLTYYEELKLYDDLDILYAYWGRDYSKGLAPDRAVNLLKQWIDKGNVSVLEYYSDFFMMSELYPPLHHRIVEDAKAYQSLGVKGLLNLVVPLLDSSTTSLYKESYDYQAYHQSNNLTYSKVLWKDHNVVIDPFDYQLEKALTPLSRYNTTLFPKRLVDVKIEDTDELLDIKQILQEGSSDYTKMLERVIDAMLGETE